MDFRYTDEENAFLKEVQQFIAESVPPGWLGVDPGPEEEANEEVYRLSLRNWRRLGERHWIGLTYPPQYGGEGAPLMKEMILLQELAYRGCPGCDVALVEADLILQFGTEEQKQRLVPPIMRGEVKWAIGMSEPNAGSDTFNVQLAAIEQGDCYVLNVRVPKEDLLGKKNGGLQILMYAFGAERSSGLYALHNSRRYLDQLVQYCKKTVVDGKPLSQDPAVRNRLGHLAIEGEIGMGLGDRLNWMAS